MWVGEGTRRDCLYNRELCCHILPLPECGCLSLCGWFVQQMLFTEMFLFRFLLHGQRRRERVCDTWVLALQCVPGPLSIQTVPGTGWTWVGVQGRLLHLLQSWVQACAAG